MIEREEHRTVRLTFTNSDRFHVPVGNEYVYVESAVWTGGDDVRIIGLVSRVNPSGATRVRSWDSMVHMSSLKLTVASMLRGDTPVPDNEFPT